jgi:hypothetical protein
MKRLMVCRSIALSNTRVSHGLEHQSSTRLHESVIHLTAHCLKICWSPWQFLVQYDDISNGGCGHLHLFCNGNNCHYFYLPVRSCRTQTQTAQPKALALTSQPTGQVVAHHQFYAYARFTPWNQPAYLAQICPPSVNDNWYPIRPHIDRVAFGTEQQVVILAVAAVGSPRRWCA